MSSSTLVRQIVRQVLVEDISTSGRTQMRSPSVGRGSRSQLPGLEYGPGSLNYDPLAPENVPDHRQLYTPHRAYKGPPLPAHMAEVVPSPEIPFEYNRWIGEIAKIESGGKSYQAVNDKPRDSGPTYALGKYQFVPSHWWDDIKEFAAKRGIVLTGTALPSGPKKAMLPDYQKYLDNPQLQEDFMKFYVETHLMPKVAQVRKMTDLPQAAYLSDGKLLALMHYQGSGGAVEWMRTGRARGSGRVTQYINRVS